MNGSKIVGIEYYLPKKKENNKDLKRMNPSWDLERVKKKNWNRKSIYFRC